MGKSATQEDTIIQELFEKCIRDTRRVVGDGPAQILEGGSRDPKQLRDFISNCVVKSTRGKEHGKKIRLAGGVSLEDIVVLLPGEFQHNVVQTARETLLEALWDGQ